MSHDPFSERHHRRSKSSHSARSSSRGILTIVGIIAAVGLMAAGGVYFAVYRVARPAIATDLPARSQSFAEDASQFNQSLADPPSDPCSDPEICDFVMRSASASREGALIPFSRPMFIEAISMSPNSPVALGLVDRLSIQNWLSQYEPTPNDLDAYERIINVRVDEGGQLATVDLIVYSEQNQAESQQWFLVKEDDQWKVYDWQNLEEGRRMSDEYAGFVHGSTDIAGGYDLAIERAALAQQLWDEGNVAEAKTVLQQCESMPMLDEDRSRALLRIAYSWMANSEYPEAIRTLESITNPNDMWGVWPVLGICYVNEGKLEQALQAAENTAAQSPENPRTHWLFAVVYKALGRDEESADKAAKALKGLPKDTSLIEMVAGNRRLVDIPVLAEALGTENVSGWLGLVDSSAYQTEWAEAISAALKQQPGIPAGLRELALGNAAWSKQEYDDAATYFLAARNQAKHPAIEAVATKDLIDARIQQNQYSELFDEAKDLNLTLETITRWAFSDEFHGNLRLLLEATASDQVLENPWFVGLTGWAHHQLGHHADAATHLKKFLDWLINESTSEDRDLLIATAEFQLTDSWLETGRATEVMERFSGDPFRHNQVGDFLLARNDPSLTEAFMLASTDSTLDSIRLQRLRLKAAAAAANAEVKLADALHRQAIELAHLLESEGQVGLVSQLIRQRAHDLVLNRAQPSEIEWADADQAYVADRNQLVVNVAAAAAMLQDADTLEQWVQRAEAEGIESGDVFNEMQYSLASLWFSQGAYGKAIAALKKTLQTDNSAEQDLGYQGRSDLLVQALLEAKRNNEAKKWFSSHRDPKDTGIADETLVAVAAGEVTTIGRNLSKVDAAEAASWLSYPTQNRWMERNSDSVLSKLLPNYPLMIGFRAPEVSGFLIFRGDFELNADRVKALLRQSLDQSFEVSTVKLQGGTESSSAWLATTPSGHRLLFGWESRQYRTDGVPQTLADQLSQPVRRLSINVLDHQAKSPQRLFAIAASLSVEGAIAFYWDDASLLWTGKDLPRQLKWDTRAPITASVQSYAPQPDSQRDDESADATLSMSRWSERLQKSGAPIPVVVTQYCNGINESIDAVLEQVDEKNNVLLVRAKSDGKISPLIRAGTLYSARPVNVWPLDANK